MKTLSHFPNSDWSGNHICTICARGLFLCLALMLSLMRAQSQSSLCGTYLKPPAAQPPTGPLFTDRFGNTYSQQELEALYQNAVPLQCTNTGMFNLLIQTTIYNNTTFPTPDQEAVICEVFSYLSGLITAPGTGGPVNININFDPSMVGSGAAGYGTPLFSDNCGIGYSNIQEQLNTQNPNIPLEFPHGTITINPEYNWYTEIDLDPAITNQQVDLYTVVLHEALHVLGFASQTGATGNSLNSFYTLYDLNLTNPAGVHMILSSSGTGDCCQEYVFNTTAFPNMPTPILTCGNVEYDVAQTPPVHGNYNTSNPDDATAANILSHLSIVCGSENYVMHSHIGFGAFTNSIPNIRRALTAAEQEIMCSLGYDLSPACDASCFVIVRDDGPFVVNETEEIIPYEWFTANDFDAEGNYNIIFDMNCGDIGGMGFDFNNITEELTITLGNTPFGEYEICYTIWSCDGELCQTGTIELIVADEIDPLVCKDSDCNLTWYGDFELFPNAWSIYYQSFSAPSNTEIIVMPITMGNPDNIGNTVDILSDGGNQLARFRNPYNFPGFDEESLLMPLCTFIPEGCDISIAFDACLNGGIQPRIGVWVLSQLPASLELPEDVICNGVLFDNIGNEIGICIDEVIPPTQCDTDESTFPEATVTGIDFNNYSFPPIVNPLNAPIKYLWFRAYGTQPSLISIYTYIDNVVVTTACQHQATITPTIIQSCAGGQAGIELEVCLDDVLNTTADVTISPNLQGIPGISLSNTNPDFPGGVANIQDMEPGECQTLSLFLDVSAGYAPGTEITIPLDVALAGACIADPDGQDFTLTMEECVLGCDCPPGSIQIGSPGMETLLSSLVPGTLPANPTDNGPSLNLTISGTLVIDATTFLGSPATYTFPTLSNICMAPGARIRVPANNTLRMRGTHIRGCDKRWEGIIVETNAKLDIGVSPIPTGVRCLIEDAQHAVHPLDKANVSINRADFEDNFVSLFFNTPGNDFTLQQFVGNNLSGTAALKPHYDSQATENGPWSYAGIQTTEQGFMAIGVGGNAPPNTFNKMRNGIITDGCSLTLLKTQFSQMQNLDYPISGYGVHCTGTGQTFTQPGACTAANTVTFTSCNTGIRLKGMNATVRNNTMSLVKRGIEIRESPNRNIDICGNNIVASDHGVYLWYNDPAALINVHDNDIDVFRTAASTSTAAITARENGAPQPNANISNQLDIDVTRAGAGISLNGCNGYNISDNYVYPLAGGTSIKYAGISLTQSPNTDLTCNVVMGDNANGNQSGPTGIKVNASTGLDTDCNSVHDTYLGVQFDMGCGSTDFRTTTFQDNHFGLHYRALGITGDQPMDGNDITLHGNRWDGTWGGLNTVGARHESTVFDWVNESQYIVPSINAPLGPQNPTSVSGSWFDTDPTEDEFGCNNGGGCAELLQPSDPPIRELDLRIAQGLVNPGEDAAAMKWMLDRDVYRKLYASPELIEPGSVLDTFYDAKSATTVGKFTEVETDIHTLFELDATTEGQLQDYYNQLTVKMEEIASIDDLLQTASGQDSINLQAQRVIAVAAMETLSQSNLVLATSVLQARRQAANAVIAQNNYIAVSQIWEQNEKMVNHIFLNTLVKGIVPNYTQVNLLTGIALQCPYEGGTAVFRARAILGGLTEDEFDDETLCGYGGGLPLKLPSNLKNMGYILYPNPTQGMVNLKMPETLEGKGELLLFNLYGQAVSRFDLPMNEKQFSFSTDNLQQGVYLVRLLENGEETFSTKLIVIK